MNDDEFLDYEDYKRSVRFRPWRERALKVWKFARPILSKLGEITITIVKGFIKLVKWSSPKIWTFIKGVASGAAKTFKEMSERSAARAKQEEKERKRKSK